MRIANTDKKIIKSQIRLLAAGNMLLNRSELSKGFGISRVTVNKWLDEIRREQLEKIDFKTRRTELWRLEEKARQYILLLSYLQADVNHLYDKFPHVLLGIIKTEWQIDKEVYMLKLDLYSRELNEDERKKIRYLDKRIQVANVVNVGKES